MILVVQHGFKSQLFTWMDACRGDHFLFGSVFIRKKINKSNFFFLKKPKPVQTSLARFSRFWLDFSSLARFFPVFSVWVRFGSVFQFFAYETEPADFFKMLIGLIGFFFRFGFFNYFFSVFSI